MLGGQRCVTKEFIQFCLILVRRLQVLLITSGATRSSSIRCDCRGECRWHLSIAAAGVARARARCCLVDRLPCVLIHGCIRGCCTLDIVRQGRQPGSALLGRYGASVWLRYRVPGNVFSHGRWTHTRGCTRERGVGENPRRRDGRSRRRKREHGVFTYAVVAPAYSGAGAHDSWLGSNHRLLAQGLVGAAPGSRLTCA